MLGYSNTVIGMSYCKNDTATNGDWCKSKDEIDDFLSTYPQFFMHMVTKVQEDIFRGDPLLDQFPYNGDDEVYFPTVREANSIKFGPLTVDSSKRDINFMIEDIAATYHSIRLYDDPLDIKEPRMSAYVNLRFKRDLTDKASAYDFTNSNTNPEDMIRVYMLEMDNAGEAYERRVKTVSTVLVEIGGLSKTIISAFFFTNLFLGVPFKTLDLSINFRRLQQINGEDCFCAEAKA